MFFSNHEETHAVTRKMLFQIFGFPIFGIGCDQKKFHDPHAIHHDRRIVAEIRPAEVTPLKLAARDCDYVPNNVGKGERVGAGA